jgi:uncharacterized metal-binding protein
MKLFIELKSTANVYQQVKFKYMKHTEEQLPLVYSCSGCSSSAQMANYLAVQLDRQGVAEMSCIAGVGGNVKKLVKTATSGRKIIVIDGCPLACSKHCLENHAVNADIYFDLSLMGVSKKLHEDFCHLQAKALFIQLKQIIDPSFKKSRLNSIPL